MAVRRSSAVFGWASNQREGHDLGEDARTQTETADNMTSNNVCVFGYLLALVAWETPFLAQAGETTLPLHQQIDTLVATRLGELKIIPAETSSDAEFVRRVYLDLTGVVPTARQARSFLIHLSESDTCENSAYPAGRCQLGIDR